VTEVSIQSARENAVLDALARKTGTVGGVMSALDGNGMPASPHGVSDLLAGLVRRGLVSRSGSAYRLTSAGQAAIRRRRAAHRPWSPPGRTASASG
jgi:DNA-binding IclR family transcriptional regulator